MPATLNKNTLYTELRKKLEMALDDFQKNKANKILVMNYKMTFVELKKLLNDHTIKPTELEVKFFTIFYSAKSYALIFIPYSALYRTSLATTVMQLFMHYPLNKMVDDFYLHVCVHEQEQTTQKLEQKIDFEKLNQTLVDLSSSIREQKKEIKQLTKTVARLQEENGLLREQLHLPPILQNDLMQVMSDEEDSLDLTDTSTETANSLIVTRRRNFFANGEQETIISQSMGELPAQQRH